MYFLLTSVLLIFGKFGTNPRASFHEPSMCHNSDTMWHTEIVYRGKRLRPPLNPFPYFSALRLKRSDQEPATEKEES